MFGEKEMDKDHEFLAKADLSQFQEQWIAVCDESIVSHGKNLKHVLSEAKKSCGEKTPLMFRVPKAGVLIL